MCQPIYKTILVLVCFTRCFPLTPLAFRIAFKTKSSYVVWIRNCFYMRRNDKTDHISAFPDVLNNVGSNFLVAGITQNRIIAAWKCCQLLNYLQMFSTKQTNCDDCRIVQWSELLTAHSLCKLKMHLRSNLCYGNRKKPSNY